VAPCAPRPAPRTAPHRAPLVFVSARQLPWQRAGCALLLHVAARVSELQSHAVERVPAVPGHDDAHRRRCAEVEARPEGRLLEGEVWAGGMSHITGHYPSAAAASRPRRSAVLHADRRGAWSGWSLLRWLRPHPLLTEMARPGAAAQICAVPVHFARHGGRGRRGEVVQNGKIRNRPFLILPFRDMPPGRPSRAARVGLTACRWVKSLDVV